MSRYYRPDVRDEYQEPAYPQNIVEHPWERTKQSPDHRNNRVPQDWATQPKGTHYEPHS